MRKDFEQIIHYGIMAPSGHNTQPWKFGIRENGIVVFPDYSRALPVVDPDNHALFISLGCAVENIIIAAEHYGYSSTVQIITGGEDHIWISLHEQTFQRKSELFDKIDIRQSTRNVYNGRPIPREHLHIIKQAAAQDGVNCFVLTEKEEIEPIIELVKEGCVRQFSNHSFVEELIHWIRFNSTQAHKTRDGLYAATTGNPNVPEWFGKLVVGIKVNPSKEAKKCESLIRSSSAVAVFIGKHDDVETWINVGRSFERFALASTALGIHHAHENMPCEELPVREKLARLLKLEEGEQPLLLLRLGYSDKMPYSYRRPVDEVILSEADHHSLIL
ncbi:MAG TPA: hypothetical protein VGD17_07595 [Chitinophagaceae bacterium]